MVSPPQILLHVPASDLAGGILGFFCSHAYAHSSKSAIKSLPRCLKGSDLVLYSVFKALRIKTSVLPVIEYNGQYVERIPRLEIDSHQDGVNEDYECLPGSTEGWRNVPIATVLNEYLAGEVPKQKLAFDEYRSKGFPYTDDVDGRWKVLLLKRRIPGLANFIDRAESEGFVVSGLSYRGQGARVGSSLHAYQAHSQGSDDADKVRVPPLD